jgi:hypothetical protein
MRMEIKQNQWVRSAQAGFESRNFHSGLFQSLERALLFFG